MLTAMTEKGVLFAVAVVAIRAEIHRHWQERKSVDGTNGVGGILGLVLQTEGRDELLSEKIRDMGVLEVAEDVFLDGAGRNDRVASHTDSNAKDGVHTQVERGQLDIEELGNGILGGNNVIRHRIEWRKELRNGIGGGEGIGIGRGTG